MHGLAGSGAFTALTVASAPTAVSGVLYMLAFGVGSIAGMAAFTGALGASFRRWVRSAAWRARIATASGVLSIVLGVAWGYEPLLALAGD